MRYFFGILKGSFCLQKRILRNNSGFKHNFGLLKSIQKSWLYSQITIFILYKISNIGRSILQFQF